MPFSLAISLFLLAVLKSGLRNNFAGDFFDLSQSFHNINVGVMRKIHYSDFPEAVLGGSLLVLEHRSS